MQNLNIIKFVNYNSKLNNEQNNEKNEKYIKIIN